MARRNSLLAIAISSSVLITACSTPSAFIQPAEVSRERYQNLSCAQLTEERGRLRTRLASEVKHRSEDQLDHALNTGMELGFWAALLAGSMLSGVGDGDLLFAGTDPEYILYGGSSGNDIAWIKGEIVAVRRAINLKKCG